MDPYLRPARHGTMGGGSRVFAAGRISRLESGGYHSVFGTGKEVERENQEQYEAVLAASDFTESLTHRPYESPVQFKQKNRFFIEKADGLLILYDEEREGSPVYMLNEAKGSGKRDFPIYTITMDDLRVTVEECSFYEE